MTLTETDVADIAALLHDHHGEQLRWPEPDATPDRIRRRLAAHGVSPEAVEITGRQPRLKVAVLWR